MPVLCIAAEKSEPVSETEVIPVVLIVPLFVKVVIVASAASALFCIPVLVAVMLLPLFIVPIVWLVTVSEWL